MATLQMGEYVPNVSNGVDTYSLREPLGVCAGICPFNFPAMIPLWVTNSKNTFCISLVFLCDPLLIIYCVFVNADVSHCGDMWQYLCLKAFREGSW